MGFAALTTTSGGLAFALGKPDGYATREETLENARSIVSATTLPVAADLENGYGDSPEDVAETIRHAVDVGLVGASIEDFTGDTHRPIYDFQLAVERIAAAVEVVRALPFPFILVARSENFLHGRKDLSDTIRRLQAFEEAGADVLYAPGIPREEQLRSLCRSVSKPVNALFGTADAHGRPLRVPELADCGARRISLGSALCRAALGAFRRAADEVRVSGTCEFASGAIPYDELNKLMEPGAKPNVLRGGQM